MKEHKPQPNVFEWYVMSWSAKVSLMAQYRKNGIYFKSLKYEGLLRDPIGNITEVFKHLNISLNLVEVAHQTMEQDSQAGTFIGQAKRVDNESWVRTPQSDRKCNVILKDSQFDMSEEVI